jgi:signal transduction histidine kinase/AmiR/NasT family two-component response regulator
VNITSSVQTKEDLSHQNDELRQILDNVPVSIIVFRKKAAEFSVVSVNKYLCNTSGITYTEFLNKSDKDMLGLIHPDDEKLVEKFFRELFLHHQATAEATYRGSIRGGKDYCWFHCRALQVPQPDGATLVYAVYTDATYQKMREEDFNRILQELLRANPDSLCAFRLNLTQNRCSDGHGVSAYINLLLDAATADELLERISSIITEAGEAEKFRQAYNRQQLLADYQRGEDHFSTTYRRLIDVGGESHWVTTYFRVLQNPYSGDVEAIVYSVDSDAAHKREEIHTILTEDEYDYIGIIDSKTEKLQFYYKSPHMLLEPCDFCDYDESVRKVGQLMVSDEEREQYYEALCWQRVIKELQTKDVYITSYFHLTRGKERCRKQVSFRYLGDNHEEIMISRADVTATFQHEEEYAARLRNALLSAEKANELKSEFLGNVSHDMRTPLNAIMGYNRLAIQSSSMEVKNEYLKKIGVASDTLLALINDTLDLQKIENGTVSLKPEIVNCKDLLQEIVTSVKPLMAKKNIEFVIDSSRALMVTIKVDPIRIRQIFINLLSNAAKFTPAGGHVDFIVECLRREHNRIYSKVTVRDTGVGISEGFLDKIYEPFSQERTAVTAHIEGSGLGLSIVKRLVDLMQGHIAVKSLLGQGSEFIVELEFECVDEGLSPVEAADAAQTDIHGTHILLCEDNEMNMEIAKTILEMNGAVVDWAADGTLGVDRFLAAPEGTYDLILMDIRMPVMDGYEACTKIRSLNRADAQKIPILALTADAYASDVERTKKAGMNGHIAKPIDSQALLKAISHLTKKNE